MATPSIGMYMSLKSAHFNYLDDKSWNQLARYSRVYSRVCVIQLFTTAPPPPHHRVPNNIECGIFSKSIVEYLAISSKSLEPNPSIALISMVLIKEMGVFTSSNTLEKQRDCI